jgi:hypothetical protein
MPHYFPTGAAGFIASRVAELLPDEDDSVGFELWHPHALAQMTPADAIIAGPPEAIGDLFLSVTQA